MGQCALSLNDTVIVSLCLETRTSQSNAALPPSSAVRLCLTD